MKPKVDLTKSLTNKSQAKVIVSKKEEETQKVEPTPQQSPPKFDLPADDPEDEQKLPPIVVLPPEAPALREASPL